MKSVLSVETKLDARNLLLTSSGHFAILLFANELQLEKLFGVRVFGMGIKMKRKLGYLCTIMLCIAAIGAAFSYAFGYAGQNGNESFGKNGYRQEATGQQKEDTLIVTSFYPIYIIAKNLTAGIDGVHVQNLTPNQTGCLHDYQMTTGDMKLLERADVLLLNGGGMETFLERVAANLPNLSMIFSEEGIDFLDELSEHSHAHEPAQMEDDEVHAEEELHRNEDGHPDEEHVHGEYNAHVWLDPERYEKQVRNLADGLIELDPAHRTEYEENRDSYLEKIQWIEQEYRDTFKDMPEQPVIIFHDAFAYLAELLPVEIVQVVEIEGDESALSAGELAEITEEIELHQIRYLLMEEQYRQTVADVLAVETGTETVILDSLVTGDGETNDWLDGMQANLEILRKCFLE